MQPSSVKLARIREIVGLGRLVLFASSVLVSTESPIRNARSTRIPRASAESPLMSAILAEIFPDARLARRTLISLLLDGRPIVLPLITSESPIRARIRPCLRCQACC
jgi:hypothetical protein